MDFPESLKFLCLFIILPLTLSAQSPRIDSLNRIIAAKKEMPDTGLLAAIDQLFEEYNYRGDAQQASYYANLLIEESAKRNHAYYNRQGRINKAYMLYEKNLAASKSIINTLFKEATAANDPLILGQCYLYKGWDDLSNVRTDSICYFFEEGYALLTKENNVRAVEAYIGLAVCINGQKGDALKEPLRLLGLGLEKARAIGDPVWLMKILTKKAFMEDGFGNDKQAADLSLEAVELAKKQNYVTGSLVDAYLIIADLAQKRNDRSAAIEYAQKAYELSKQVNRTFQKCRAANTLANFYIDTNKKLETAKALLTTSLQLATEQDYPQHQAFAHLFLGNLYEQKQQLQTAKTHYIKGITLSEANNLSVLSLRIQAELSDILIDEPNDKANILAFLEGDSTNVETTLQANLFISKIHLNKALAKQDYSKSFFWSEQIRVLENHQHQQNLENSIKENLLAQELANQEKELRLKEQLVQTTTYKNWVLSIATTLATLLVGILFYLFSIKKKQHQKIIKKNQEISKNNEIIAALNKALKEKNRALGTKNVVLEKEVVDYIAYQSNRDMQIKEVKLSLDKLIEDKSADAIDWQLTYEKVEHLIDNQDDWQHFKQKIEHLYPNFFRALTLRHPNLNKREKTHCAYILVNMSIKQVAEALFITPKTVESARYRVKKKLGLDKSTSLTKYIKSIHLTPTLGNREAQL